MMHNTHRPFVIMVQVRHKLRMASGLVAYASEVMTKGGGGCRGSMSLVTLRHPRDKAGSGPQRKLSARPGVRSSRRRTSPKCFYSISSLFSKYFFFVFTFSVLIRTLLNSSQNTQRRYHFTLCICCHLQ